jgi:hypothetical protein
MLNSSTQFIYSGNISAIFENSLTKVRTLLVYAREHRWLQEHACLFL